MARKLSTPKGQGSKQMTVYPVIMVIPKRYALLAPKARVAKLSLLARRAATASAKKINAMLVTFPKGAKGQPLAKKGIRWSLSHKPQLVIGVACRWPVGIDCEMLKPTSLRLKSAVVLANEIDLFRRRNLTVLELFSAKESALKLLGRGIGDLRKCSWQKNQGKWLIFHLHGKKVWVLQKKYSDHVLSVAFMQKRRVVWSFLEGKEDLV